MKAYNLHDINDLRFENVAEPVCNTDSAIVRIKAAGICGSDIPRIYKTGTYHFPTIPGHEFAGEVVSVGTNVSPNWKGKRVGVFPLIPCMKCQACKSMRYEMCDNYNYLGSRCNGGFAEYVEVPEWNLIEIPDSVTFEQAAMLEPLAVALHAIRQSGVKAGDSVAVIGLGTIGLFVVMFLKKMGIDPILCVGNKDYQRDKITELGIDTKQYSDVWQGDSKEWIRDNTNGLGAKVIFECVGKNDTLLLAIESVAPSGIVQLVGNPAANMEMPKSIYWRILRKQLKVVGTWNSSFTHTESDDWHYVLESLSDESIHPEKLISHHLSFEELERGLAIMRDKSEDYTKVMVSCE